MSADTVGRLLKGLGYSLLSPAKVKEGTAHPDRDGQFPYLHGLAHEFVAAGDPVISVDTKKKEMVGEYANGGVEWQPAGQQVQVNVDDFVDPELGRAIRYGIYDETNNEGWVTVGDVADTAEFAVNAIRSWWTTMGRPRFGDATRLLITADAGGSNGHRVRLWKTELAKLAAETGLEITVCHYPPGNSKWNRIEPRMFSFITMNWRGCSSGHRRCPCRTRHGDLTDRVRTSRRHALPPGNRDLRRLPGGESDQIRMSIASLVNTELTVRGSSVGTRLDLAEALAFAASGQVTANTHRVELNDLNEVLDELRHGRTIGRAELWIS